MAAAKEELPRAGDASRSSQKSMEGSRFKAWKCGALPPGHREALRLVLAVRWERDPKGQGKLSSSTSVDNVRGPGLPQAPYALL